MPQGWEKGAWGVMCAGLGTGEADAAGRMLKGREVWGGCYLLLCPTKAVLRVGYSRGMKVLGLL